MCVIRVRAQLFFLGNAEFSFLIHCYTLVNVSVVLPCFGILIDNILVICQYHCHCRQKEFMNILYVKVPPYAVRQLHLIIVTLLLFRCTVISCQSVKG